jgi:NAD(P)-dependent dehydrogenase (short-subunit alcohol dehydrogenase family)
MNTQGKTFVVTGGGSGLGEATVRLLVEGGAKVLIADVNEDAGKALAGELGNAARFSRTDVTNEAEVQATVDLAVSEFGALHGVVNCAGIGAAMRLVSKAGPHPLDLFKLVLEVNVVGTFNCMRLGASAMMARDPDENGELGVIVNTASVAAFDGQIGQVAYSASKGAVVAMTLPVARELARAGIRVVTIAPGLFDTPMMAGLPEEARASLGAQVPFPPRLGHPSEYAALAKHIIENIMLNGETIRLDGAIRMQPK